LDPADLDRGGRERDREVFGLIAEAAVITG
jgi:hypothetical protein